MKKFFVSTPIYYPNEKLHIGHAYTTVLADYISRYKKSKGYNVFFVTGSDEHGQKIEDRAKAEKMDAFEYVTKITFTFKSLWEKLGIDYNLFIRTTDHEHCEFVSKTFSKLLSEEKIRLGFYKDNYCKSCESYFSQSQLKNDKCPQCEREVTLIEEESFFLGVEKYKDFIIDKLKNANILFPHERVNELLNSFLNESFRDLSVSRTTFNWGIKVKENPSHVIYVWLDALMNYLSALSYENKKKKSDLTIDDIWGKDNDSEILQIVGKEITRFHAIYWPILLEMLGYKMPKIFAHGWILVNNSKMSKSVGNVVDPNILTEKYGRDSIRFFLINSINTGEDGSYSEDLLVETINSLLVNKYSNLVNRTFAMFEKYFNNKIPNVEIKSFHDTTKTLDELEKKYDDQMNEYRFSNSTKTLISYCELLNKFIDEKTPWSKTTKEQEEILVFLIQKIYRLNELLSFVLIDSTKKFFEHVDLKNRTIKKMDFLFNKII